MKKSSISLFLIAVVVAALWGFNFVVIAVGLKEVPPLLLGCLRFIMAVLPAIFFVKKPKAPWKFLILYGILLGVGQFGFLFTGMKLGAPAGLSSLVLQSQAFFTAFLAVILLKEKLRFHNYLGFFLAFLGLLALALSRTGSGMTLLTLGFIIAAALMWAFANITAKKMPKADSLGLMVWSSLFSPVPLLILSLIFEGPGQDFQALSHLSLVSCGSVLYLAFVSTLIGYGLWNYLIKLHGPGTVAPFSLLVPIFGLTSAALLLNETMALIHWVSAFLILSGLIIHVFGGRFLKKKL